ncbi:cytochrome P450 [Bacillus lacus]|uniref:Bifunctional cytochrome P450/NADPH--P450 reductase n=1 Tax=Metabacillus lacus TaxID=1983721 RepID=A0A7X2IX52_9BACI|nr:bifunctional cytochrome P450/NADPH--P450 reductase [Metabacillus lacus]MRX70768.1 cytochrome P450 [Metabacillus lacus]
MLKQPIDSIPQPKTYGPLKNLPVIDKEAPTQSFTKLANEHGPIFRMELPGRDTLYVSGHKLVEEVCDEKRFAKNVWLPLQNVREFAGDGLFTSWTHEDNWKKAHQILLPSFSQRAMQDYHEKMVDIALQLIQKWSRLNEDEEIEVPDDMTRLTLDTIGLCGFNYRFNSFYSKEHHPFVGSMVSALDEAMNRLQRLEIHNKLSLGKQKQYQQDIKVMYELVDTLIQQRKRSDEQNQGDLLSRMLEGEDPKTGDKLSDENIRYQMITFLIAGHETTSGLLSFALYYLLKHPEKLKKAQDESDAVLRDELPSYEQVKQLKYVRMVLNEALRLWPTAPAFSLYALEDTKLAGKYDMKKGDSVNVLIPVLHRDKEAWGEDAEDFRPERFEDPAKVPQSAYKPFGNGQRACIGQQFALHEATLVLGMILREFDLIDHSDYQLEVKETLTLKPHEFKMKAKVREKRNVLLSGSFLTKRPPSKEEDKSEAETAAKHGTPLMVLYGSSMGTAEGVARELAETGKKQGYQAQVFPLDEMKGNLPEKGLLLLISSSYNGQPPENAADFLSWLQSLDQSLSDVTYAVFGCGDSNWSNTYQKVPADIDGLLQERGAQRLIERGEGDASGDFEMDYHEWTEKLWQEASKEFGVELKGGTSGNKGNITLSYVSGIAEKSVARNHLAIESTVTLNKELQSENSRRSTRHIEIAVPKGISYSEGDHLGIIPKNNEKLVKRVLNRFQLSGNEKVIIEASGRSSAHLPAGKSVSLHDILSYHVELQEPASRAQIQELAKTTVCPPHRIELEEMLKDDNYSTQIAAKRISMLDLLEQYEACMLPFEDFLGLLPALKPRYYSISSSPSLNKEHVSITVSVVKGSAWSGKGDYEGTASNYLKNVKEGDDISIFFRTQRAFRLPENHAAPIVMVGPGTGIAPFRGFLQAREALKRKGAQIGEAHLYFGCRNEEHDYLYREELEKYRAQNLVKLHTAFSRAEGSPKTYVQHLMEADKGSIIDLLTKHQGHLYICGDGKKMAPDVENMLLNSYSEIKKTTVKEAENWLIGLQTEGRYAKDVW